VVAPTTTTTPPSWLCYGCTLPRLSSLEDSYVVILTLIKLFIKTSQLWKSLAPTEKEKWTCEYEKDKIIYDDRYKKYMSTLIPSQVESIRDLKEKQAKDKIRQGKRREKKKEANMLGKPRYPGNGFTLFMISLDRGETPSKNVERWPR
ncbi:hypothetical protein OTU49_002035, partial [Cherax quadricarinatus]